MESTLETPTQKQWSRFSITLFVLSILQLPVYYLILYLASYVEVLLTITVFLIPVLSIGILILNIIGIKKVKKEEKKGKGFSIAGVVLSSLSLLVVFFYILALLAFAASV